MKKAIKELSIVRSYPFDRFRKRKSTVHKYIDGRYLVVVIGAPEILLDFSSRTWPPSGEVELTPEVKSKAQKYIEELASSGYRTFGVAYRVLSKYGSDWSYEVIERDLVFYAVLGIIDPPREGVREAVELAKRAGV